MDAYVHFIISLVFSLSFVFVFNAPNKITFILMGSLTGTLIDIDHFFILLFTNFEEVITKITTLDILGLYHSMATCDASSYRYFIWHSSTILILCGAVLGLAYCGHISHKLSGLMILVLVLHFFTDFWRLLL